MTKKEEYEKSSLRVAARFVRMAFTPLSAKTAAKFKKDTGSLYPHNKFTYEYHRAISGEGSQAYNWSDKKHRLVYDLCLAINAIVAIPGLAEVIDGTATIVPNKP
jgi:hypothetical protein